MGPSDASGCKCPFLLTDSGVLNSSGSAVLGMEPGPAVLYWGWAAGLLGSSGACPALTG